MASTDLLEILDDACREYRISFVKDSTTHDWPEHLQEVVSAVKILGRKEFTVYADGNNLSKERPWAAATKRTARKLAMKATRQERRNEDTWRFACEPIIFSRFDTEVAW